jgi:hypothetical protein
MSSQQPRSSQYKQRGGARTSVSDRTQMRAQSWYSVEVRVCDVSTGGFKADCPEPVRIGSYVSLDVPGIGPVHAQVRWQLGTRMGGMFLDPISLNRCEWTAVRAEGPEEEAEA